MTAIVRGASNRATECASATCSRWCIASSADIGLVDVHLDRDHAVGELALRLEPSPLEDRQHLAVLGKDLGREPRDAVGSGDDRKVLEQDRRDAAALVLVVDRERDLGLTPARPAVVARDADEVVAEQGDERHPVVVVDGREARDVVLAQPWPRTEEPVVDALVRQPSVERDEAVGVSGTHRADVHRAAIGEDDIGLPLGRVVASAHVIERTETSRRRLRFSSPAPSRSARQSVLRAPGRPSLSFVAGSASASPAPPYESTSTTTLRTSLSCHAWRFWSQSGER